MKKIGIMTWYHHFNFGTALQVTALYETIQSLGYAPQVIRYIPGPARLSARSFLQKGWRYARTRLFRPRLAVLSNESRAGYARFLGRLRFSEPVETKEALAALQYDAYVCGSDQIWVPTWYNGAYFLDFVKDDARKIAYAPSIGLSQVRDTEVREKMSALIQRFARLSIREQTGADIIYHLCGRRAEVVLDPTLLLNAARWNEMAGTGEAPEGGCILCYFLGYNRETWRQVEKTRERLGLPVKVIPVFQRDYTRHAPAYAPLQDVCPLSFVKHLRGAAYICTDSFHGTAFSLLYRRPFSVFERFSTGSPTNQNSRIYNILNIAGLNGRLVKTAADTDVCMRPVDYAAVDTRLEKEREKSLAYLKNALAAATEGERS